MTVAARMGHSMKWVHGLACGAALAWLPGYLLLAVVLFLPLIVAYFFDRSQNQALVRMMLPYEFAAAISPMYQLWLSEGSVDTALRLLTDPVVPITAWLSAGLGWFVLEAALLVAKLSKQYSFNKEKNEITRRLKEIADEWDHDPPPSEVGGAKSELGRR
ncbi:GCN5-like N-acetyltransferase [Acetobacter nitrogenifigens DSM 23921 = NBRC 105050]|uniref:Uncharacterized protein n=1 Tax=Acetobacter nitrogenifigens DSM 23921 = NBRC 105050 TaxID=1120919 RepID=A0A511X5Y1_9PROT|nr:hypothetical protein [Acetobacter nitrogenifigens]GBQ98684.1 GCN5-like N-acetyltransferase [Acetobacter nitrogenifigens DSM 23921 = NBRC 105050]GEN58357.1 hypothetical protein ANI02nite_02410 [Acetobacter nitrogenifigens DSM 23921 = NBRC 105050]